VIRLALALAFLVGGAGCHDAPAATGCVKDRDCPAGARCEAGTGVCVSMSTPLDAGVPDLPPADLALVDGGTID